MTITEADKEEARKKYELWLFEKDRAEELAKLKERIREQPKQAMVAILGFQVVYGSLTEEDSKFLKE